MKRSVLTLAPLTAALLLAFNAAAQDHAHHMQEPATDHTQHQAPAQDHSQHAPVKPAAKSKPKPKPTQVAPKTPTSPESEDHAGHAPPSAPEPAVDHAAMGHGTPQPAEPVDHSVMGHATPPATDHAAMGHDMPRPSDQPITPIPAITDEDRAAAVPPPTDHPVHDNGVHHMVLFNRLEASDADAGAALEWEGQAWIGTDLNKLWLRSEGERTDGDTEAADLEVLYGRAVAPWWDVVAGVRHDFKPGNSQDFLAVGVMGLAPYKFEVAATAYLGQSGQTAARVEAEYETLLTNRLILQPLVEVNLYGQDDEQRGIGSGLSTAEFGVRLRYEIRREFAPYVGVVHERAFGRTADFRRAEGEVVNDTRVVAGLRIWF